MEANRQAFLRGLRELVLAEMAALRQQIEQQWRKPLPVRVADGYAIEKITIEAVTPDGQLELSCSRNISRYRPGDMLCLNRGDPFAAPTYTVSLDKDEETRLIISIDQPLEWDKAFKEREGWVLDMGLLDLSSYVLGGLAEAGDTLVGRERILPLLMGQTQPQIDPGLYARGLDMGEALGLNWNQSEALAHSYATDLAYLIQGPPGTGKTRVLAYLAQALVSDGERVLICAFTHRAINNALNTLNKLNPDTPAVKVGQWARADDLLADNHETFHQSPLAERSDGYVVGATPFATRTRRLRGVEFDTVIFDEASQLTLPLAVMGMLAGQKYIFIGDQQQLPPVLTTRFSGGAFRDSIFGYLTGRNFSTMLTETYRLNGSLTAWPSLHFYEGALTAVSSAAQRRVNYPLAPARLQAILDPAEPKLFWDLGHYNNTTYSRKEAYAVTDLITTLLACGFPAAEIGVVVPYRAQARLIRNLLREVVPNTAVRTRIVIDTVERMQGQERDLIILSLTTSNPTFATLLADFFFQPERLNVAITRPRKKLIIVGSRFVLKAKPTEPTLQANVALLADLLNSCTIVADVVPQRNLVLEDAW